MFQHLKHPPIADDSPLPDRECCAHRKMWKCCLRKKKLDAKSLCFPWTNITIHWDEKTNRKILLPYTKNTTIFTLMNYTLPPSILSGE